MTKKRGRPSSAELTVVKGAFGSGRPPPPLELTERQAAIWREVTETESVDFFSTAALRGLLADYCRHRETSEQLSDVIAKFQPEWLKQEGGPQRYSDLLRMRGNETRAAAALATKLRVTNQSRYTATAAATAHRNAASGQRPWES